MPRKFSNDSERCQQVSIILSSVNYRKAYVIHLKKSCFVEDVLFYPKNEVIAFTKLKIKWDRVSDVHVYIRSDAVIWLWKYRHVRTRQTFGNWITDRNCVVRTNLQVWWSLSLCGRNKFHCLVMVVFSALLSCFHAFPSNVRRFLYTLMMKYAYPFKCEKNVTRIWSYEHLRWKIFCW